MMAVDDSICSTHERNSVALYCQTCEILICTKCVSHSPYNVGRHKDHVYLDISEAFEMMQEELSTLISGINDELQQKKKEKQKLQSNLQNLQLCLLRKRTELERSIKGLNEQLRSREKQFIAGVESKIVPDINKVEELHKNCEFDVVSGEGLLGTALALQEMPNSRAIAFLKSISSVKKQYNALHGRSSESIDASSTIQSVVNIHLNFQKEKYQIDRALKLESRVPEMPHILYSWCVVGHNSASVVWKFPKMDTVTKFVVYYKKFTMEDLKYISVCDANDSSKPDEIDKFIEADNQNRNSLTMFKPNQKIHSVQGHSVDSKVQIESLHDKGSKAVINKPAKSHTNIRNYFSRFGWCKPKCNNTPINNGEKNKIGRSEKSEESFSLDKNDECKIEGITNETLDTSITKRIRKLSYTISSSNSEKENQENIPDQLNSNLSTKANQDSSAHSSDKARETIHSRQFIDPTDFLNETQKYKKEAENKSKVWPSSHQPRSVQVSSANSNRQFNSLTAKKNFCPNASRSNQMIKSGTSIHRAQSVEAPSRKSSVSTVPPRSTTPQRYPVTPSSPRPRRMFSSPVSSVTSSNYERISRRDHPKSNHNAVKSECDNSSGKRNAENISNEKSQLKKKDVENLMKVKHGISEEWLSDRYSKQTSQTSMKLSKNNQMNAASEEKNTTLSANLRIPQKEPLTSECDLVKIQPENTDDKPRVRVYCKTEYIDLKKVEKHYMKEFMKFKVSKFVVGRVQATLRDLESDTDYFTLVTAVNQNGQSPAAICHFKTGVCVKNSTGALAKCGCLVTSEQRIKQLKKKTVFANIFSYFFTLIACIAFSFLILYLFTDNLQFQFCQALSKEGITSNICPNMMTETLYKEQSMANAQVKDLAQFDLKKAFSQLFNYLAEKIYTL